MFALTVGSRYCVTKGEIKKVRKWMLLSVAVTFGGGGRYFPNSTVLAKTAHRNIIYLYHPSVYMYLFMVVTRNNTVSVKSRNFIPYYVFKSMVYHIPYSAGAMYKL